ncbi:uncharacterized protein BDW43DRAFT_319145 [Aspergillus alliaceus]|uniref:uncharacterized protein n=1 Tax=Petromyces alliaceus TaxID=209559 RepID=UPI0012A43D43|nr:uncharacterized protein BDW43DRAFT_319145 [Aspergillus alliaceus]KAB8238805.1 hypothetical protein BDW43DRAFT_319145 [Aspergillus alliaceus]
MSDYSRKQKGCKDTSPGRESCLESTHSADTGPHRMGKCQTWLTSAGLRSIDLTTQKVNTFISSSIGRDTVLGSIEYLSHALHYIILSRIWRKAIAHLHALLRLTQRHNPTSCPGQSASSPLLSLSSIMFDARSTIRLLGLFSIWTWGSETTETPPLDQIIRGLTRLQLLASTTYQLLENVAFLMSKDVLPTRLWGRRIEIEKLYFWSLRALGVHMVLQLGKLWREKIIDREGESGTIANEEDAQALSRREEIRTWRKSLVSSFTWATLCAHWGMPAGIGIPESFIGALSFVADAWELKDTWSSIEVAQV